MPPANELRAINELPVDKSNKLNDRSATGWKIWRLLMKYERTQDVSLLEEAGRLLWEQVMSRPESMMDCPSSDLRQDPGDRSGLIDGRDGMNVPAHKPATSVAKGRPKKDRSSNVGKGRQKNNGGKPLGNGERLVEVGAPAEDRELREYREWDSNAVMPPKKRSKLTCTSSTRDIQFQFPSTSQGYPEPGHVTGGYEYVSNTPAGNMSTPSHSHINPELHSQPRTSQTLSASHLSNSQSSDRLNLPSSPAKSQPLDMLNRDEMRFAANGYYASKENGNGERPQPYAPGNFSTFVAFKDA